MAQWHNMVREVKIQEPVIRTFIAFVKTEFHNEEPIFLGQANSALVSEQKIQIYTTNAD